MKRVSCRGLLRVHAGGRLVEQQQLRLAGQRARNLQPPLVAVGQIPRRDGPLAVQPDVTRVAPAPWLARLILLAVDRWQAQDRAERSST